MAIEKSPSKRPPKAVERFWKNKGKNLEKRGKVSEKRAVKSQVYSLNSMGLLPNTAASSLNTS